MERAKWLLSESSDSTEAIAPKCGYVDVSSFRKLFVKRLGMTPKEYWQRFAKLEP